TRRHAADKNLLARAVFLRVGPALLAVKQPRLPGDALRDDLCLLIDEDGHVAKSYQPSALNHQLHDGSGRSAQFGMSGDSVLNKLTLRPDNYEASDATTFLAASVRSVAVV